MTKNSLLMTLPSGINEGGEVLRCIFGEQKILFESVNFIFLPFDPMKA